MNGFFAKERIVASSGFNRWRVPIASVAIHLCIGSVYAWSIFNSPLTRLRGVVAPVAGDWSLGEVVGVFTVAIVCLGLSAAVAGKWLERVGPRTVGLVSALCWGGGFLIGALGIRFHQRWLLYLGYGVVGGCGLGLGYVSPVSTLLKWFPDRRGMAAGLAIMGFGGGAILGTPLKEQLLSSFFRAPAYYGPADSAMLVTIDGRRHLDSASGRIEVVVIDETERKLLPGKPPAGVYEVGGGSAGVFETFLVLGLLYAAVMAVAAMTYRLPAPDWQPPSTPTSATNMNSTHHVAANEALKTPQFYLLWIVLCLNVTAGIGILGVAKTMLTEIFAAGLPTVVTSRFTAAFVMVTSVANMVGRFVWASASDRLGRQRTYDIFFTAGPLLYSTIPFCATGAAESPSALWLIVFCIATLLIFTMYGGGFATIPAYLADLFGTRFVGSIHGRLLTAWSTAGVLGPLLITTLRERSLHRAIVDLAGRVNPERFAAVFGAPVTELDQLVEAKTVTIVKLMAEAPPGTLDPSSTLYNSTMFAMAGLLLVALVANRLVRPVDTRHFLNDGSSPR